ncbi:MAG: histidinol dehydrogenase [Thermodesulfobacteriota bacterium]|nr:histidinol dehydrogenase [Thermodesulfobacteriota bacterium]
MKVIGTNESSFAVELDRIRNRRNTVPKAVEDIVSKILDDVEARGDDALFEYTERFDGILLNAHTVEISPDEIESAFREVNVNDMNILRFSAARIEKFHRRQIEESWSYSDDEGVKLGQVLRPLERVGIYAPGGLATYPSTVLMAAVPARIAGVGEIVLVTPAREGRVNPVMLVAARLSGVNRIFKIGGAQAIAALACGTKSVPRVDKIVGPGNIYVATAKRMVYGKTGIDMIAGPSEIVIISDGMAEPEVIAADLLSQAEHDPMAGAILLTPDRKFAGRVAAEARMQAKELESSVATEALENYGAAIITADMDEAIDIANSLAPEHLELAVEKAEDLLSRITNAGAIFLGWNTPEVLGDYIAGPNHILPTGGTARFSSPLGVYDFIKRINVISFSDKALEKHGLKAAGFADIEGLEAHKRSIMIRLKANKTKNS